MTRDEAIKTSRSMAAGLRLMVDAMTRMSRTKLYKQCNPVTLAEYNQLADDWRTLYNHWDAFQQTHEIGGY